MSAILPAAILAADGSSNENDEIATDNRPGLMILTATGIDKPNAGEDIMAQLQSYKCGVLGADRATANGYFSLLPRFKVVPYC